MRENRTYGSEGGERVSASLPLSCFFFDRASLNKEPE